ncbi:hypothetical protein B7494_g2931 [Chlorociboria aeruginascens]|nr:hypothetical protein B7494_g2931 [Chlorociboria aeruginascens]
MATSTPSAPSPSPSPSPSTSASTLAPDTALLLRNLSIAGTIVCPIILLLPPRRLDLYTFSVTGCFLVSSNHVVAVYSGSSIMQRFAARMQSLGGSALPEKAKVVQERLRREREIREGMGIGIRRGQGSLEEVARVRREEQREVSGLRKFWYAAQAVVWKQDPEEEEEEMEKEGTQEEVGSGEGDREVKGVKTNEGFEQQGKVVSDALEKKKNGGWSLWASK